MEILSAAESKQFSTFLDSFNNNNNSEDLDNTSSTILDNQNLVGGGGGMNEIISGNSNTNSSNFTPTSSLPSSSFQSQTSHPIYAQNLPNYTQTNSYPYLQTSNSNNSNYPTLPPLFHSNSQPSYTSQFPQLYPSSTSTYNQINLNSNNLNHRPGFPSSISAPLPSNSNSNPYPTQPLASLDDDSKRRMAQQALDLKEWMNTSVPILSNNNGDNNNYKGKSVESRKFEEVEESSGVQSPPKRIRPLDTLIHLEVPYNGTISREETLNLMKEVENKTNYGYSNKNNNSSKKEVKQSYPPLVITPSVTKKPSKRKAPTAKQESPPQSDVIDHIRNPPPASTPSNIPPSPLEPRPIQDRPNIRTNQSTTSTSTSTSTSTGKPIKVKKSDTSKPILLSTEQKKANHIASEQKRRAAIRSGYEGLCSVVPSLKAAVEEFEERVKKANNGRPVEGKKKNSVGGGGHGALMGGIEVGGEKVDGRAGPRSEAVVLGKSVDHLRYLLQTREELLNQLSSNYDKAQSRGIKVPANYRIWEEIWIETDRDDMNPIEDEEDWSDDH